MPYKNSKRKNQKSIKKNHKKSQLIHKKKHRKQRKKQSKKLIIKGGHKKSRKPRPKKHKLKIIQGGGNINQITIRDHFQSFFVDSKVPKKTYYCEVKPISLDTATLQWLVDNDGLNFMYKTEKEEAPEGEDSWLPRKARKSKNIPYMGFKEMNLIQSEPGQTPTKKMTFPSLVIKKDYGITEENIPLKTGVTAGFTELIYEGESELTDELTNKPTIDEATFTFKCHKNDDDDNSVVTVSQDISYAQQIKNEIQEQKIENSECTIGELNPQLKIIEEIKTNEDDTYNYKIVIYPDINRYPLLFSEYFTEIQKILPKHLDDSYFQKLLVGLYNAFEATNKLEIDEDWKLLTIELEKARKYVEKLIVELKENKLSEYEKTIKIQELNKHTDQKAEDLLKNLFNKPFLNARFNILFFKKGKTEDSEWEHMILHLSELNSNHTKVLEKTQKLLDEELTKKLYESYKSKNSNYMAYHKLGDFFSLVYEYVHPITFTSSIPSHDYRRMVQLSELIYRSTLPGFNAKVSYIFNVRSYRIVEDKTELPKEKVQSNQYTPIEQQIFLEGPTKMKTINLKGSEIICCCQNSISEGHSIDIYFKQGDYFYFMRLKPCLTELNLTNYIKSLDESIYDCLNQKIMLKKLDTKLPIFKVTEYFKVDNTEDKKQFNFMNRPHTFPAMVMKAKPNELDEELGLNISEFYPPTLYRFYLARDKRANVYRTDKFTDDNQKVNQKVYHSFIIEENNKTYRVVINKENLTQNDNKFVIWIFEEGVEEESDTRIKDMYDLEGKLLSNIIVKLKKEIAYDIPIYNPKTHFLGINNFLNLSMNILHLHIIPKKFYNSSLSLKQAIDFNRELRMISAINVSKNLEAYPQYYKEYFKSKYFRINSVARFNLQSFLL